MNSCRLSAVTFAFLSLILVPVHSYAAPMGPVKPLLGRFSAGIEVGIDRRDMESSAVESDRRRVTNKYGFATGSFGLTDNVVLTGRFGLDYMRLVDFADVNNVETVFGGSTEFGWGAAVGAIIMERGTWEVAANLNYTSHLSHIGNWPNGLGNNVSADYSEWNAGLQVQGRYRDFTPYLGAKFSNAEVEYGRPAGAPPDNSRHRTGLYGGAVMEVNPDLSIYAEGRLIDEFSISGGALYQF